MRKDAIGFWWEDLPPEPKQKKEAIVREAPDPVWRRDDYLPNLDEALAFPVEYASYDEIMEAKEAKDWFLFDIEIYPNYFCAIFRSYKTGKVLLFEEDLEGSAFMDRNLFKWCLENLTVATFNGINFDLPLCAMLCGGRSIEELKQAADDIILNNQRASDILQKYKIKKLAADHIDIIEVAPLFASLKAYGGRLHVPRMQDLPFHPSTVLNPAQKAITRWYCVNDTTSTGFLAACLKEQIDLRYVLSNEIGIDLRSKSDAQIAEQIIGNEYHRKTGKRAQRPKIEPGTVYFYEKPYSLNFTTPLMQHVLHVVRTSPFEIGHDGKIIMPKAVGDLQFQLGNSIYQMGIGGLHSMEKTTRHITDDVYQLVDKDVASYYPMIILENRYFPEHMGPIFLEIYGGITKRRLAAKAAGNKPVADSLKIVINGTFGKLLSPWSIVYAPKLGFHVTIGGQLFLLMYVEALESHGISVVSGNTDGIMVKCPRTHLPLLEEITKWWERTTGFTTEGKNYRAIYSRDINNYIAIDEKGIIKHKGAYANPWNDPKENPEKKLHKNPVTTICIEAVDQYLLNGKPLHDTIYECKDIRKFIRMQSVTDGAVKIDNHTGEADYLGKQIRWYYSVAERGNEILRAKNGHKVPSSDGGRPCMQLPESFPNDVDYDWYLARSTRILKDIGAITD